MALVDVEQGQVIEALRYIGMVGARAFSRIASERLRSGSALAYSPWLS